MKLGIGLPESLPYGLSRTLLLDWARLADLAGFHTIAVRDRPCYDMWDPLLTLAAVAAVTERARLATTVLQLPIRNAIMVAKQAAVIDQLSDGRFDLGIGLGSRQDDYAVYGATMEHRITRYRDQVGRDPWSVGDGPPHHYSGVRPGRTCTGPGTRAANLAGGAAHE